MQTTHQNQKRDLLNAYIEKHEKNTAIDYKKKLKIFEDFKCGVVSVLDDAMILSGNCPLVCAMVGLGGMTNDTIRNNKKEIAVKYPT
jgi:hypothetical protein